MPESLKHLQLKEDVVNWLKKLGYIDVRKEYEILLNGSRSKKGSNYIRLDVAAVDGKIAVECGAESMRHPDDERILELEKRGWKFLRVPYGKVTCRLNPMAIHWLQTIHPDINSALSLIFDDLHLKPRSDRLIQEALKSRILEKYAKELHDKVKEELDNEYKSEISKLREKSEELENSITKLSESPKQLSGVNIEPLLARISQNESEIASLSTLEFFKKKCRESSTFLEFASNSSYKAATDSIGKVILKKLEKIGILKFDPNVDEKFTPGESITTSQESSETLREFNLRLGDIEDKIDILEQSISKRNEKDRETVPDQKLVEKEEPELVPADQI